MIFGIENRMLDSRTHKSARKFLGFIDGNGTHEHGLSFFMTFLYLLYDSIVFSVD